LERFGSGGNWSGGSLIEWSAATITAGSRVRTASHDSDIGLRVETVIVRDVGTVGDLHGVNEVRGRIVLVLWKEDEAAKGVIGDIFHGGGALPGAARTAGGGGQFNDLA
jgi:hypothetical protein